MKTSWVVGRGGPRGMNRLGCGWVPLLGEVLELVVKVTLEAEVTFRETVTVFDDLWILDWNCRCCFAVVVADVLVL